MIYILTIGLIVLLLMGVPVAMSVALSALGSLVTGGGMIFQFSALSQKMQFGLQNFILIAIPLFILTAKLMNSTGITKSIFSFANALVGFLPGGLAQTNIIASLIFAGMSGAAVVDASGLGQIEIEAMTKNGYPKKLSVGITAASSAIGPIFPPSIPMVVFAFVSGASVGRLFLGGVIPGILMAISLMIMVVFYAKRKNLPRQPVPSFEIAFRSFTKAFFPLLTPVILLGGIWGGIFTPTEAAAVAGCYALIIGVLVLKLSLKEVFRISVETARESAKIGLLVATASLYGWVLMRSGITIRFSEWVTSISLNPLYIFLIINIFLLLVGCFLDSTVAILILGPLLVPIIVNLGIDITHFGVVMVLNLMIGLFTPPFGIVLFVMSEVSGLKFEDVVKSTFPFLIPIFVVLVLIIIFPVLVTGIPNYIMGG
jgi:tripartite ATP-independent transporter DctM subunit